MTICSLIEKTPQLFSRSVYREIRFGAGESTDSDQWHEVTDLAVRESGLIIPKATGVGWLWAKVGWESFAARYEDDPGAVAPTKYGLKFVRDPWTPAENQTGAQHFAPVPYGQNHITSWVGVLRDAQPLALFAMHNGNRALNVTLAEYKAWMP